MYATRLYGPVGGGGGGGGGLKQGRRTGVAMLEAPHSLHPHLSHHPAQPPPTYPVYSGRPDTHRGVHFHPHYHPQSTHLGPPSLLPHYQNHAHFHAYGGGAGGGACGKKKTWNFIHEKMSYDTFFTMKRLIERSRHAEEVLRWITQNPSKISHNHYPVALQKIGQLLQASPPRAGSEGGEGEPGDGGEGGGARQVLEQQDFQTLCDAIVGDCAKFDNFSIVNCLYAVAALGESSGPGLLSPSTGPLQGPQSPAGNGPGGC